MEEHPFHPISFTFHRKFELFRSNFRRTGFEWNRWKLSTRISTRLARSYLFNSIANYLSIISEERTFSTRECVQVLAYFKSKREDNVLKIFNEKETICPTTSVRLIVQRQMKTWKAGKGRKFSSSPRNGRSSRSANICIVTKYRGGSFDSTFALKLAGRNETTTGEETMTNIVERCTDRLIAVHRDRQRSKRDSTTNYA